MTEHLRRQLRDAQLRILGRLADASNVTLLACTEDGTRCVYKPTAGERPLWDFPAGSLAGREVATDRLASLLGWSDLVPATEPRSSGPHGPGVCQEFVAAADRPLAAVFPTEGVPGGWLRVAEGTDAAGRPVVLAHADDPALRRLAVLDVLANNADRKGSHILPVPGGVRGIDHGLTFHHQDKLRTVLWGFAGQPLGPGERAALEALRDGWDGACGVLADLVSTPEVVATRRRLEALLRTGAMPEPGPGWPRLPWPPL